MRVSQLFAQTLRETPGDAILPSHQLLIRGGYIKAVSAGIYSIFPLGKRVLRKIEQIIREEMENIQGQEMELPVVQPADLWKETGRYDQIGSELLRFQDRNAHEMVLAMTHEEVVTDLIRSSVSSYKQLPITTFQFQTKYRDEARARGGLIRVREFIMKDAYSFHANEEDLDQYYQQAYDAYIRIFNRVGIDPVIVQSDTGIMGGKVAHEFMLETTQGEDHLILCRDCGYQANAEIATFHHQSSTQELAPLEKVHTPGSTSIHEVSHFLNIEKKDTAKTMFYQDRDSTLFVVIMRGDLEVSEIKLKNHFGVSDMFPAESDLIRQHGFEPGFAGLIGQNLLTDDTPPSPQDSLRVVADLSIAHSSNLVTGANELGYHYVNSNLNRDYQVHEVIDLAQAESGFACPHCHHELEATRGIEIGNIFKLGTKFSDAMGAHILDFQGKRQSVIMGCYGIGIGRLMASVVEQHHDKFGIMWPKEIAPYQIHLISLGKDEESLTASESLYDSLRAKGIEVLWDDRNDRPGVKFKDADLWGCPLRIGIGGKAMKEGLAEWKLRTASNFEKIPMAQILDQILQYVNS